MELDEILLRKQHLQHLESREGKRSIFRVGNQI